MTKRTEYSHGTPSWVDLSTTDPDKARAFYGEIFGWNFEENPIPEGGAYVMADLEGASVAGLMQQQPEQAAMGIPPMWNSYITVSDLDATTARVAELGGQVMAPPMDVMTAGRMSVIVDPAGAVVCLWEANEHPGAGVVNEANAYAWNEMVSPDVATAATFFEGLLGWTTEVQDMGPMGQYTLFNVGGEPVAGGMAPPMDGIPPHWGVYFMVADAEATATKAQSLGATVINPVTDTPVGKLGHLADPQGAAFAIMQPPASD